MSAKNGKVQPTPGNATLTLNEVYSRILRNRPPLACVFCRWDLKPGAILIPGAPFDPEKFRLVQACHIHSELAKLRQVKVAAAGLALAIELGVPEPHHVAELQKALLALRDPAPAVEAGSSPDGEGAAKPPGTA